MALNILRIVLLLTACLLPPCPTVMEASEPSGTASPMASDGENCPLQTVQHSAEVLTPLLELHVGEQGFVEMAITPAPGNDFYVSALAKVVEKPPKAKTDLLPGFPKLRFSADTAGRYVLELRITLVSKSSCGGVKARELAEERVHVQVKPR